MGGGGGGGGGGVGHAIDNYYGLRLRHVGIVCMLGYAHDPCTYCEVAQKNQKK